MRRAIIGMVAIGALLSLFSGLAIAQSNKTSGSLQLTEGTAAAGTGFSWSKGTLTYQGKKYPVKVDGLSVGEAGVDHATALGKITNLKSLDDFDGNYVAAGGGATVAKGTSVAALKNQNGVKIAVKSATKGASLKLAADGIKLSVVK